MVLTPTSEDGISISSQVYFNFLLGESWCDKTDYATEAARIDHQDALDADIASWTSQRDKRATETLLRDAGIPASAVQRPGERIDAGHGRSSCIARDRIRHDRKAQEPHLAAAVPALDNGPETLINEHIDENWKPVLQTPPFPEYTSGHSVVSGAAATALTNIFGDNFSFDDDTEVAYGLPIRSFSSFDQAADEAAISRMYGGIHYRAAVDIGVRQGRDLGKFIMNNLKMNRSSN